MCRLPSFRPPSSVAAMMIFGVGLILDTVVIRSEWRQKDFFCASVNDERRCELA